jgi:hypothetical protein
MTASLACCAPYAATVAHNCAANIDAAQATSSRLSYPQNMRGPARAAPRPPRPHAHRDPPRRENTAPDRVTPPAQPPAAARTRKQAITQKRLDAGRAVAYREQWCLRAPSRPSPSFGKR